jgi:hypothetical protein
MMTAAEARLLTDLRRINETTVRLEHTLAASHRALLRARAADRRSPSVIGKSDEQSDVD